MPARRKGDLQQHSTKVSRTGRSSSIHFGEAGVVRSVIVPIRWHACVCALGARSLRTPCVYARACNKNHCCYRVRDAIMLVLTHHVKFAHAGACATAYVLAHTAWGRTSPSRLRQCEHMCHGLCSGTRSMGPDVAHLWARRVRSIGAQRKLHASA